MDNEVRRRREAREMSQADLAEAVGVTRQTINSIERGRYDPSLELAFELAAFFDCRIEDLFHPDGG
jgi:putative transcriptional regulator